MSSLGAMAARGVAGRVTRSISGRNKAVREQIAARTTCRTSWIERLALEWDVDLELSLDAQDHKISYWSLREGVPESGVPGFLENWGLQWRDRMKREGSRDKSKGRK